ncbi:MAG: IS982 family transposase [Pseudobdellovibrionaceae bacterium]
MSLSEFIILAFCLIDDELKKMKIGRLRQRGFEPGLTDSETITMEIVGEFLGIDTDKGIWTYFTTSWKHFFPKIPCRTTFARHAANLWRIKQLLQDSFSKTLGGKGDRLHIIDGLPMPICTFGRAYRCKIFQGEAAYGYCAAKKEHYYGFEGHVVINSLGVIVASDIAASNIDERDIASSITDFFQGILLGDKGYIRPALKEEAASHGLILITPMRSNMKQGIWEKAKGFFSNARRKIETVISQLSERLHIEEVRARDAWHLTSRWARKLLTHTTAALINYLRGAEILDFDALISPG